MFEQAKETLCVRMFANSFESFDGHEQEHFDQLISILLSSNTKLEIRISIWTMKKKLLFDLLRLGAILRCLIAGIVDADVEVQLFVGHHVKVFRHVSFDDVVQFRCPHHHG